MMTRIKLFKADTLMALEVQVNSWIAEIEGSQHAVKDFDYHAEFDGYSGVVVWGKGPKTTTRWSGLAAG